MVCGPGGAAVATNDQLVPSHVSENGRGPSPGTLVPIAMQLIAPGQDTSTSEIAEPSIFGSTT